MDYIGIDPAVGLECSSCKHVSRLPYSELLNRVMDASHVHCGGCQREMLHDWTTVSLVQNIIRDRLHQAHQDKAARAVNA